MADISSMESMGLPSPPNWARRWLLPLRAATLEVTGPVSNLDLAISEVTEGNYGNRFYFGIYSDLMGFYSDLMGFYSDLMGFYSDLMRIYSDLMGY